MFGRLLSIPEIRRFITKKIQLGSRRDPCCWIWTNKHRS